VKAALVKPKNWDSKRVGFSDSMLTAIKGPAARGLAAWIALAINSLPVPVSPVTSTGIRWRVQLGLLSTRSMSGSGWRCS